MDEKTLKEQMQAALNHPPDAAIDASRRRIEAWFRKTAPVVYWDQVETPLGAFYVAATARGILHTDFGRSEEHFFEGLDPMARIERNPEALAEATDQLRRYFEEPSTRFTLALDLTNIPPFHREAMQLVYGIPAGTVWTYKQVAEGLGKPRSSRAVGQAMARNPIPVIVPCHRVVGSSGALTGYGGAGGIPTKRRLLQMEGARVSG